MEYSIWILVAFFRLELLFRFESIRATEFVFPFFPPFSRVFDLLFFRSSLPIIYSITARILMLDGGLKAPGLK